MGSHWEPILKKPLTGGFTDSRKGIEDEITHEFFPMVARPDFGCVAGRGARRFLCANWYRRFDYDCSASFAGL